MATVAELLLHSKNLQSVSDSAMLDVELLLCFCLEKRRSFLRAWPEAEVSTEHERHFLTLLERRIVGEPIAYITGERGFWSLDLQVNASTLIPRPETELLVEKTLELMSDAASADILDLGTGSGAIALALASEKSGWCIVASDVQPNAVALAESNKAKYSLNNVTVLESNWFDAIGNQCFDVIVSNPPYIDPQDNHLEEGDVSFEPRSALVAENHGLADLEHIADCAGAYLKDRGWLLLEHGYNQADAVQALLLRAGFTKIFTAVDLSGWGRLTGGQFIAGVDNDE
ncbi:Modification methylase HemK [marine gamma proteobacterium HTCC2143]|jgi:release factor glutamine methyltransferase|uniref:Release factor glutamine methyltransferase n=1 Tax=marine gamma proteobacterium HTCC2143 TaxID=247633 RepID=A0YF35_9GAMM|nr:Modification methylase HemK [marine gamma proteobacterium HTCC2143]